MEGEWLTAKEAAERAGVKRHVVYAQEKKLPRTREGVRVWFRPEDVDAWAKTLPLWLRGKQCERCEILIDPACVLCDLCQKELQGRYQWYEPVRASPAGRLALA